MPGWVTALLFDPAVAAAFWGVMASVAAIVACCGPSRIARICAIYLLVGWAVCNVLHLHFDYFGRREGFAYLDAFGGSVWFIVWLARPRAWLGVVVTATFTQLVLHIFAVTAPKEMHWALDLTNNLLYGVQLIATCMPTFFREKRGPWPLETLRRPPVRARRPARINPPYPGWEPPSV